jgi:hypothetical protein
MEIVIVIVTILFHNTIAVYIIAVKRLSTYKTGKYRQYSRIKPAIDQFYFGSVHELIETYIREKITGLQLPAMPERY